MKRLILFSHSEDSATRYINEFGNYAIANPEMSPYEIHSAISASRRMTRKLKRDPLARSLFGLEARGK